MEGKQFDRCVRRLKCNWWFIGGWLRRKAARELAADNSPRAVGALARAWVESKDRRLHQLAGQSIEQVSQPAAIAAVCEVWMQTRHAGLGSLIATREWIPTTSPQLRVLTALLCDKGDRLSNGNADIVSPLVAAASDADLQIATRARAVLPKFKKADTIDEFCRIWSETRAPLLDEFLLQAGYVPRQPPKVRVLIALRNDQGAKLKADGPEVVEPLALACSDQNAEIATRARAVLVSLTNLEAHDAVCRVFNDQGVESAKEAAIANNWSPKEDLARAVFYFLTGQWERYDELDFDRHLLRTAFGAAQSELRQRLLAQMRAAGRADLLTSAVGLGEARGAAGMLPEAELRSVIGMLEKHQEWGKLWGLVFEVPFVWSARLVRMLREAKWQPEREDAREVFAQLHGLLAQGLPEQPEALGSLMPVAVCLANARVVGNVNAVAFARDRPVIAIGTGHRKLALWNFQNSKLEWTRGGFAHSIGRVAFSIDGLLLCGERTNGSDSCGLHVCDGDCVRRLGEHNGSVTGLEAINESLIMTTGRDQRVALWDMAGGRCTASREFGFWPRGLKLSPDRKRAVLSHSGVAIIDLPGLEMFQDGDDAFAGVARTVCFSPDGTSVIAGKVSGKVLALPVDGKERRRARPVSVEHVGEITGLASLTGRSAVLTGDARGLIRFITWPQQALLGRINVQGRRLTSLHVSNDEAFMVTGDSDERIGFWDIRGLEVPVLLSRPLIQATPTHLGIAASFRQAQEVPAEARNALAFLEVLLRYKFRYDIEIDEITGIQPGEFDIEIEG
jgi:hypothetical protein